MEIYSVLGSITTVVSFLVFLGIVGWAYSKRRAQGFAEAANAPFALPDDCIEVTARAGEERS
jgi:cytochrome c oxidase cbb3-type subunit 4